ncbi:pilus assembly protein [Spongiactinospora rosea]|uniref:Pilus assembly protein n=1 Tax=Spongiactinospora rosea TaxID=2248750 RepID=A0A366LJQ1_9ACTN|nr:TadE/TadG family type IV pilus assembly protein [Spongiactinospora rosea]RBQ13970.1 pilus assembly protein [Spongiactinospora rosea]
MSRDRGSATLEATVIYPGILLLLLLAINTALWFHARSVALAAAQEGLRAGRSYGAGAVAGKAVADRFIKKAGGAFLKSPVVRVTRAGNTLVVTVRGDAISLVPLMPRTVEQVARAPVERWTTG